ncbi:MAG TPA: DUF4255 domain-containing protein [Candidatus Elarobacter sp.]|jgi:hypothetical protein
MSNFLAIAAVTATLQSIVYEGVRSATEFPDTTVTILPLDRARGTNTANQLNLFLYLITRNAAWSNLDMPRQVKPGETSIPPLALNLHFLLTAFGLEDDATAPYGHELLGRAMSVLHDHPVLSAADIRNATHAAIPGNDLDRQIDHVRLTFVSLNIDELSKLWTGFSMQYRLSAAYEVGVTLIESTRATKTPVPVLARGAGDLGSKAQTGTTPPLPQLFAADPPNAQPAVRLGEKLTFTGLHLDGANAGVRFSHALWSAPVELAPDVATATATSLVVTIPNDPAAWPAGFYTAELLVQRTGETFRRVTNQLGFALAPSFTLVQDLAHPTNFTATVTPQVRAEQRATLILGDREIGADAPRPAALDTLTFTAALDPGLYWSRLRVDGVDSLLVDRTTAPPAFDPSQQVTVA